MTISPSPIRILVLIITVPSSPRRAVQESYITRHLPLPGISLDYRYLGASPDNDTSRHYLAYPRSILATIQSIGGRLGRHTKDLISKDFFALALHAESCADWMVRITDDTVINFDRLPHYLRDLTHFCDPFADVVLRANCIDMYGTVYPQGGSGILFSRAASAKLAPRLVEMLSWYKRAEDIAFGRFLAAVGIGMAQVQDLAFIGLGWSSVAEFENARRAKKEPCGNRTVGRLRDVVFYHALNWRAETGEAIRIGQLVYNEDPRVMLYIGNSWPRMCVRDGGGSNATWGEPART
jgi:hypothetical protein